MKLQILMLQVKNTKSLRFLYLATLILLIFILPHAGISQGFSGGLMVGGSLSQINGDEAYGYNKLGILGGVRAGYRFSGRLSLEMEMLYNQKGSRVSRRFIDQAGKWKIALDYFEIPILIGLKDWLAKDGSYYQMNFYGGLSYGYLFNSEITNQKYKFIENDLRPYDFSFILGTTYYINRHFGITGRYQRSITKLWKTDEITTEHSNYMLGYQLSLAAIYMF